MSSAAASIRCSQLSRTSRLGDCASRCAIRALMSARCSAVRVRRPLTESRTPRTDPTSTATSSAAVTPASSTKWTTGCAASRASACASRVLPRPPAPTMDTTRALAIRARSRARSASRPISSVAVVAHPPADRAVEREQAAVRALQQLAGIRAEPLAQVPAVALETLERCRRAADRGLAAQQVREQRLVLRRLRMRRLEDRQRGRVRARPAGRPGQDHPRGGRIGGGGPPDLRQRAVVPVSGPGRPAASARASRASPSAAAASRSSTAAAARTSSRQPAAVDLARRGPQPVPGAVPDDRVRAARVPGPRHQHLQALLPVARRVVAPDQFDQLVGPHRTAVAGREGGEQRLRAIARDRSPPPAHIGEQGQGDAHRTSLEARGAGARGPLHTPRRQRPATLMVDWTGG